VDWWDGKAKRGDGCRGMGKTRGGVKVQRWKCGKVGGEAGGYFCFIIWEMIWVARSRALATSSGDS
jgi:hypothetical protein